MDGVKFMKAAGKIILANKMVFLSKKIIYRLWEMLPGFLTWATLLGCVVISIVRPMWAIYFIIIFDLYWLWRVIYLAIYILISWHKYRRDVKINWFLEAKKLPRFNEIYHIVFLPTYKEPIEVIRLSLKSLAHNNYPLTRMIVVLGGEARDKEKFQVTAETLKQEFAGTFYKFLVTLHPDDIVGELAGKGSNIHWMGLRAKELIDQLQIPYSNIIVSTFDVDTCVSHHYFSYLTYKYLTHPHPERSSFQPVAIYNNNIWESYSLNRIIAYSTTFWLFSDMARLDRLCTFSSHSMSWRTLVEVGFWQNDVVSEDSRIFWQCFTHYHGNYSVTPLFLPVSMDTVYTGKLWSTMVNQYKQQRRWAYGAENIPYVAIHFCYDKQIPLGKKLKQFFNLVEGYYSWATAPIIIFLLGRLPLYFLSGEEEQSLIAHNAPIILNWLMILAMIGLLLSAILSVILLPPKPQHHPNLKYVVMILQWLLFPIAMLFFSALPAIDAQTRLLLGKYMGFWVTAKQRSKT